MVPMKLSQEALDQIRREFTTSHPYVLESTAPSTVLELLAHIDALELEIRGYVEVTTHGSVSPELAKEIEMAQTGAYPDDDEDE